MNIKKDKWYQNIIYVVAAVALNTLFRFISVKLNMPLLGNQFFTLTAGYVLGPWYAVVIATLTTGLCTPFAETDYLYLLAIAMGGLAIGNMRKHEEFLYNFFHCASRIFALSMCEGVFLALTEGLILKTEMISEYSEAIFEMLTKYNFPSPLRFFLSSFMTVFTDVLLTIFVLWIVQYVRKPFQKKKARRDYLKRNLAAGLVLVLTVPAVLSLFSDAGSMQAEAAEPLQFTRHVYDSEDGLTTGTANDIIQTDEGTMWVATNGGLCRFNGKDFELMADIPNVSSVKCLYIDSDGNLWIGNNGTGIVITTSGKDMVTLEESDGLISDSVRSIVEADYDEKTDTHMYYVGTPSGISIVTKENGEYTVTGNIEGIACGSNMTVMDAGKVLVYDTNGSLAIIENGDASTDIAGLFKLNVTCVKGTYSVLDSTADDGLIYIGTDDGKVCVMKKDDNSIMVEQESYDCLLAGSINDIYVDDEIIYVCGDSGLGYIDANGIYNSIYVSDFDSAVEHILKDYQGNIWFTSSRCGILCLMRSSFTELLSFYRLKSESINTICSYDGWLCAGGDRGITLFDTVGSLCVENGLTKTLENVSVRHLMEDSKGNLWVSTYSDGLYCIYDQEFSEVTDSTDTPDLNLGNADYVTPDYMAYTSDGDTFCDSTYFTYETAGGAIAAAGEYGLIFIRNNFITARFKSSEYFGGAEITSVAELSSGVLLVGTDEAEVYVIENKAISKVLTRKDGLLPQTITRLVADPVGGGVFVLTNAGICYISSDYTINEVEGFSYLSNYDLRVVEAQNGYKVFVTGNEGILIADYYEMMEPDEDGLELEVLDAEAGLPGYLSAQAYNYLDDDGLFYICGSTGIYILDTEDYETPVDEYKPVISVVSLDGDDYKVTNDETITIPTGVEKVQFTIELNNYTATDPLISYWLSGGSDEEKNSCYMSEIPDIIYTSLSAGSYNFHIVVYDTDDETKLIEKIIPIVKKPENYETPAFRIYFFINLTIVVGAMAAAFTNIGTSTVAKKQQDEYEKKVAKLEREKAEALETALRQEERANKSKSDFLASMSHEIRTPINAILGMDTMIIRESNQPVIKKYAQDVESAGKTLLALINDILDFSKIESGKMELVLGDYDLSSIINDLINMVRPKTDAKGLSLEVSVNPDIPAQLYGDEIRVKQCILNILNNAVKYTEKGTVALNLDYEKVSDSEIALKVNVKDTGIGIKAEDLDKLFSPYQRIEENRNKNVEGTGLGMAITKTLLELMNSHLSVESTYGVGSSFSFTIIQTARSFDPIGDFEARLASATNETKDVESFHAPDAKILVVDDMEMNLIVAKSLMKRIKVQVTTASSGMKAVELTKENAYDLIFLDAMMPEMSGEETLAAIRKECTELNGGTPIIVLTANAIKGAREEYLSKGFSNYLSKPIESHKLEAMIQCYLPADKIIPYEGEETEEEEAAEEVTEESSSAEKPEFDLFGKLSCIPQIQLKKGIETAGGEDIYKVVCRNFYDTSADRITTLEKHYNDRDVKNYTIQVHALKSSARLIGAYDISEKAWELEQAGREENWEKIDADTQKLVDEYRALLKQLDSVYGAADKAEEEASDKPEMSEKDLKQNLKDMSELLEAFDFDTAKELFGSFADYKLPDSFKDCEKKIRGRLAEVDRDAILELIKNYLTEA